MEQRDGAAPEPGRVERWRVGSHYGIHVYQGDRPVATFHDPEDAARAVRAVNDPANGQAEAYKTVTKIDMDGSRAAIALADAEAAGRAEGHEPQCPESTIAEHLLCLENVVEQAVHSEKVRADAMNAIRSIRLIAGRAEIMLHG